jgi:hypothetical protein
MDRRLIACSLVAALSAACADRSPPEEQIRALIETAETAAEARSVGGLMDLVAPGFSDRDGRSADELAQYVRGYFIANQSVHLLTRIDSIEIEAPDVAAAQVTVAMVGRQAEADAAWDLAFEVVDFDIDLRRVEDDWKVVHVDWRRAGRR